MLIELSLHIKDKESTNTQSVSGIRCASQSSCTCTIFYFLQLARKCEAASDEGKCDREFFFPQELTAEPGSPLSPRGPLLPGAP